MPIRCMLSALHSLNFFVVSVSSTSMTEREYSGAKQSGKTVCLSRVPSLPDVFHIEVDFETRFVYLAAGRLGLVV